MAISRRISVSETKRLVAQGGVVTGYPGEGVLPPFLGRISKNWTPSLPPPKVDPQLPPLGVPTPIQVLKKTSNAHSAPSQVHTAPSLPRDGTLPLPGASGFGSGLAVPRGVQHGPGLRHRHVRPADDGPRPPEVERTSFVAVFGEGSLGPAAVPVVFPLPPPLESVPQTAPFWPMASASPSGQPTAHPGVTNDVEKLERFFLIFIFFR